MQNGIEQYGVACVILVAKKRNGKRGERRFTLNMIILH